MPMVWLKARAAFTFQGRPLAIDDVFGATPIEAVQLRARRLVEFARKPVGVPSIVTRSDIAEVFNIPDDLITYPDTPSPRRRGRPRKQPQPTVEEFAKIAPDDASLAPASVAWTVNVNPPDDAA